MSRRRLLLVAVPALLFIGAVGFVLARYLTGPGAEREAILGVLRAQAAGDARDVIARISGCAADPGCAEQATRNARRLRGSGDVEILRLDSPTAYSLGETSGTARVVWRVGDGVPVVQCIGVRKGGPLDDASVTLLRVSAPLADNEGSC